jgi:hypothetical protein
MFLPGAFAEGFNNLYTSKTVENRVALRALRNPICVKKRLGPVLGSTTYLWLKVLKCRPWVEERLPC